MSRLADADDSGLLALVRDGDTSAMAELWSRHYPATLAAARRISRQPRDAEELASDAFSAMLQALGNDAGPTTSVRAYLTTAVRNQATSRARRASASDVLTGEITDYEDPDRDAIDPVAHHAELGLVREAFASLPRRWQIVLWRTAVDHDSNKAIAADLRMSPNALAALARRARRGFRTAYLQVHASVQGVAPECEPYVGRLVELLPDQAPKAGPPATVRDHVDRCEDCSRRLAALEAADTDLRAVLLPALLGLGPGIPWATAAHSGHAAGALWLKMRPRSGHVGNAAMAGAAAAVVVAGTLSAYAVTRGDAAPPQGATARSAAYGTGAPAVVHPTPDHRSSRAAPSRRSSTPARATGSSGRQEAPPVPPAPLTSAPATAPPSTFVPAPPARRSAPPPTSSATATSTPPPVTPTSPTPNPPTSTATSTAPAPTATSPVPSSPTGTGSTSPTSTPAPPSSSPTGTPTSTTPSPTSSSPTCRRICIGGVCISWCFG